MEAKIKSWTANQKAALVLEIIQGKTTVAEAIRSFNLSASEIDGWVHKAQQTKRIGVAKGHFDMPESTDASKPICQEKVHAFSDPLHLKSCFSLS